VLATNAEGRVNHDDEQPHLQTDGWCRGSEALTKSLCRRLSFDIAYLRRSALRTGPNRRGRAQEIAVLANTLGARVGARASVERANCLLPSLRDLGHILLAIFVIGAAAALFFGWLMVSNSTRSAMSDSGAESDCKSLGRGGAYCAKFQPPTANLMRGQVRRTIAPIWAREAVSASSAPE
jgi:hypothetical protein